MLYTYILHSKKLKKFYIGRTNDLKRRMNEHNSRSVPFTSKGTPWTLIYYSAFIYKEDAAREEKFLKSGKGRERRKFLLKTFLEKQ